MRRTGQAAALGVLLVLLAGAALAQDKAATRTVRGAVFDKDDNPAPTSVVYLKNRKTLVVRTYIADDAGRYRFSGLDPNVDYEIHAERQGMTSAKRTISSLDSRHEITLQLKLDKKKSD